MPPSPQILAELGFDAWAEFAALADADVATLGLSAREIDALGLDVDESGAGLLRGADGRLASWRMDAPPPDAARDAAEDD